VLSPWYVCFDPPQIEKIKLHMIAEDTHQVEEAHPDFFGVQLDPNGLFGLRV